MNYTTVEKRMSTQNLKELVEKITAGVATDAEIMQFNQWYESFQEEGSEWPESELAEKTKIEAALLRSIDLQINSKNAANKATPFYFVHRIAAAAIVLLIVCGGIYWFATGGGKPTDGHSLVIANDLAPGMEKAVLTLGDGSQIILDEVNKGLLAREGHTSVNKTDDGLVAYLAPGDKESMGGQDAVVFNTITTPRGGKYKVILPDQTEVWLNAMSSIHFPTRFSAQSREVDITGEVYFNVTRNEEQPFRVRSGNQIIRVLGTEFNVKAYPDEEDIRTTLVEGSVVVETEGAEFTIEPGQQVINHRTSDIVVEEVDTAQVTAWKQGLFQFWNTGLEEIMRQLSRWYDVEVTYLNENKDVAFTGFISRDVTISSVLLMLEETGDIKFGLEDRRVVVRTETNKNDK